MHGVLLRCPIDPSVTTEIKAKIALFCNVSQDAVITAQDVKSVYEVPLVFNRQGLDQLLVDLLRLPLGDTDLRQWSALINRVRGLRESVTIGIVGKYIELEDSYKSLNEALVHGGFANNVKVNFRWVESEDLMTDER